MSATTSPSVWPVASRVARPSARRASTVGKLKVTAIQSLQFPKSWGDDRRLGPRTLQRLDGLESIAGDAEDELVLWTELPALGERERAGDRHATSGLREHAGRLGQEPDPVHQRGLRDTGGPAPRAPD